jgi:putative ABC transport system permease protein
MALKYAPLVWGGLARRPLRTGLTVVSLMAAFALIGVLQAVNALLAGGADFLGADRLITQSRASFTQSLPMRMLPQIEAVPGVSRVSHSQFFGGKYQDDQGFFPQFVVDPLRLRDTYPEWRLPPEAWVDFAATRDGAIVGRQLAEKFGWRVGDVVPLNSFIFTKTDGSRLWEWRVVGIFDGRDEEWQKRTNLMYLNYGQFDEARAAGRGGAGVFVVRVRDPMRSGEIAAEIDARFENSPDETKTQNEQEFQLGFLRQVGDLGLILNAISGAVFFTILILTGYTMAQGVRERTSELGVLKCLGFTDATVLWLVIAEALALCLLGAGLGMLAATAMVQALPPEFPVSTTGGVWAFAGAAALGLALVTGVPPALRAQRLKIIDALAGR